MINELMKYAIIFSLIIITGCNFPDNEPLPPLASEAIDSAQIKNLQRADSIEIQERARFKSLVSVIKIDTEKKCNLTKGYFALKNIITDTTDLKLLAKYLASQLFQSSKKEADCTYPLMCSVAIYDSKKDYDEYEGDYVVMCNITPSNYSGEVYLNALKLQLNHKDNN
jgi:hypothetical protein